MEKLKIDFRPNYKYEDYIQWEGKWELIDGLPYAMSPSPTYRHQVVSESIALQLREQLANCKKCNSVMAVDWRINDQSDNNVVCPDNMVVCSEIQTDFIEVTPSLIFEILSPSTSLKDKEIKYYIYQREKVKFYVIVDIDKQQAKIFRLNGEEYELLSEPGSESFEFDLGECKIDFDFSIIWKIKK